MCLIFRCEYLLFRLSFKHAHSHTYINTLFCSLVHSFSFMFVCLLARSFVPSTPSLCVCACVFFQWIYMLHYFICCCCCFLLALKHFFLPSSRNIWPIHLGSYPEPMNVYSKWTKKKCFHYFLLRLLEAKDLRSFPSALHFAYIAVCECV